MAKSSSSGETKAPLVIALVFFVLSTIGLGVFAYMTMEDLTLAKADTKKAGEEKEAATKTAQKAGEEVLIYKAALGVMTDKDKEALQGVRFKNELQTAHKAMMDAMGQKANTAIADSAKNFTGGGAAFSALPKDVFQWDWPAGADVPAPPALSVIDATVKAISQRELNDRTTKVEQDRLKANTATMVASASAKAAAEKEFKDKTGEIPAKVAGETEKIRQGYEAKASDFVKTQQESRTKEQVSSDKLANAELLVKRKEERISIQERKIEELLDKTSELIDPFQFDKPQGKILRRYSDSLVDIDLGTSDKLRAGISFSIFPSDTIVRGMQPRMRAFKDPDGKTVYKPIPKGKIEVIDVIGPNIAQCRIIDEDSPVRDRIIPGDLLYNALWRKGTSEHVALFGIFDLDGDGRDDIQNLVQGLRRVGVVVDAYYDLGKMQWVGEITSTTNFGVEGYYPTVSSADGNKDGKIKILNAISDARKAVKDKGILILKPRDFFPRIGFNARLDVNDDAINQAATGYSRAMAEKPAEGAPADPAKN
ncbi:hypothetical protein BH11PLA2_BH11PLA2_01470 [soil metagenome]